MSRAGPEILAADAAGIARAAELLAAGGLVAVPTETVYGLAADATDGRAVARIFAAKGRPAFNPLIVHVPDVAAVRRIAEMPGTAEALAGAFWPGPMTLVLPLRDGAGLSPLVSAGLPTVAVRVPAHPAMQAVLRELGRPVAAPSANPSGRISATTAQHVIDGLGDAVDAVLDAGPCTVGVESTILAPEPGGLRLLREGGLPREAVEAVAGPSVPDLTPGRIEAPGQMERHYAPGTPLLIGGRPRAGEVTIGFGPGAADVTLSATGDLVEAASRLFAALHEADALAAARGAAAIRVTEVPETGLGRAINDRLRRAAVREGADQPDA
ncbi:L-threonylcarbamoyladenylate synthase [Roseibacterium sp. SDUM158016]|uniref:L-threonylcarbamoyladenylate synthase n=1 Tax=Roseicyclus sediminis TaxID=2980997 RepID=UPI0021CFAE11|nr:L-threonylcarbamoyladenylate synthase [Roseibacterium sp. SDUM158016]MCU4651348.1 L-threonylcarbamoyladenylate synthase [Roseibacterium sp. SDUM158016]